MYFVDQVHLVATACRRVLDIVEQVTGVVDLGFGRRVDFDQVDETTLIDLHAGAALAAGLRRHPFFTVERLGQDARNRRLADAARSGEQVGMMQAARIQGIDQGLEHVLLADGICKVFGPPLAGQDEIAHR